MLNKCFQDVFVIDNDGEIPLFQVKFDENWSKFVDLDPTDISYEIVLEK